MALSSSRSGPISPGTDPAAVVVEALAAPPDPALAALVGAGNAERIALTLRARARRWAAAVAPDRAHEGTSLDAPPAALHGPDGPGLIAPPGGPALDQAGARGPPPGPPARRGAAGG